MNESGVRKECKKERKGKRKKRTRREEEEREREANGRIPGVEKQRREMCRYRGRVGTSLAHPSRPFSSPDRLTPHAIFRLVESERLYLQHLPYYHEYRHFRTAIPCFYFAPVCFMRRVISLQLVRVTTIH